MEVKVSAKRGPYSTRTPMHPAHPGDMPAQSRACHVVELPFTGLSRVANLAVRTRFAYLQPGRWKHVRYFSPKEVANLMGFPANWSLPGLGFMEWL